VPDSASFWSFDDNILDGLSIFNREAINNPIYKTSGINGYGNQNSSWFIWDIWSSYID